MSLILSGNAIILAAALGETSMDRVQSKSSGHLGQLPSELINFMAMALAFFVQILSI
jgi:hypothetical protein